MKYFELDEGEASEGVLSASAAVGVLDPGGAASPAAAVLEKIGMHQVGHLHDHVYSRREWAGPAQFTGPSTWLP